MHIRPKNFFSGRVCIQGKGRSHKEMNSIGAEQLFFVLFSNNILLDPNYISISWILNYFQEYLFVVGLEGTKSLNSI